MKYAHTIRALLYNARENKGHIVRYGKASVIYNGLTYNVLIKGKQSVNCYYMQAIALLEETL